MTVLLHYTPIFYSDREPFSGIAEATGVHSTVTAASFSVVPMPTARAAGKQV